MRKVWIPALPISGPLCPDDAPLKAVSWFSVLMVELNAVTKLCTDVTKALESLATVSVVEPLAWSRFRLTPGMAPLTVLVALVTASPLMLTDAFCAVWLSVIPPEAPGP
ncbi:hypothetical protein GALL_513640 [mine drainage metagenome]|uniref:Uncharacterized protein n=1 Tax=mine drainage metagenome TaxID=410659 RepID=A0A1J5PHQ2_9ZZZZ